MNLTIDELKNILELCVLITINNNIVFSCPMFLLDNSLSNNYLSKINLLRYNKKYQRLVYLIGLGVKGNTKINLSTQFQYLKT